MAGGGGMSSNYEGVTIFVVFTCLVAATGALLFGYDLGISGGVTSMEPFLREFFPSVFHKMKTEPEMQDQYCKFDSQVPTLFTSSLYISALVASLVASSATRMFGRKISMFVAGLVFLIGSVLNGVANSIVLLIIGRLLLGVGVGFANQSVPVYLAEMAPTKIRGAFNMGFQMAITTGILVAGAVNYGTANINGSYGWRISLALAAVPSLMMTIAAIYLPDTPNSILERGHCEQAKKTLQKIRGTDDVDDEFQDLVDATEAAKTAHKNQWRNIIQPRYRPQLVICFLIPLFQQLTGINAIMFYAPLLFNTLGFGDEASLICTIITGVVNVIATLLSILTVDRFGRRSLFLHGGAQMIVSQIAVGVMIGMNFGNRGEGVIMKEEARFILFLVCAYVAAFAWSWGPLGWLLPTEICPLEIRSTGQAISVSVNMLFTFLTAQVFFAMLCHFKFTLFFFNAVFLLLITLFIFFFHPETNNVPIDDMNTLWKSHWFWRHYHFHNHILATTTSATTTSS